MILEKQDDLILNFRYKVLMTNACNIQTTVPPLDSEKQITLNIIAYEYLLKLLQTYMNKNV